MTDTGPLALGAPSSFLESVTATFIVAPHEAGQRLDHFLTAKYPEHSRSELSKQIASAHIRVSDQRVKPGRRLHSQEIVSVVFPKREPSELIPEPVEFSVLFEDEHLLVVNKPPGLVVHPANGHKTGTLVHGLLYRCQNLPAADAGRPGIVHRLDKDTSGAMIVAKSVLALRKLMADFKNRRIQKTYHALLLRGPHEKEGRIVAPIGRHPVDRKKMAIRHQDGRYAATRWRVLTTFANGWCWAEIGIETGRTHQIRVHMASLNAPVVGDILYGGSVDRSLMWQPKRQMLHASTLQLFHPLTGAPLYLTAPLPDDMSALLQALRKLEP